MRFVVRHLNEVGAVRFVVRHLNEVGAVRFVVRHLNEVGAMRFVTRHLNEVAAVRFVIRHFNEVGAMRFVTRHSHYKVNSLSFYVHSIYFISVNVSSFNLLWGVFLLLFIVKLHFLFIFLFSVNSANVYTNMLLLANFNVCNKFECSVDKVLLRPLGPHLAYEVAPPSA